MNYEKYNFLKDGFGKEVYVFDELSSTNDFCKDNALNFTDKSVVIAKSQFAGKGRMNRVWKDSKEETLSMSCIIKSSNISNMQLLPFVCGLSVRKALSDFAGLQFGVKWVNDVVFSGKKISGILCESRIAETPVLVCGIGVNIAQNQHYFDSNDIKYGTSLKVITGKNINFLDVAKAILTELNIYYEIYEKNGFAGLLCNEYNKYCVNIGKHVTATVNSQNIEGIVSYVMENGNLEIETSNGIVNLLSGEASIRGQNGYY
jgi:BirA family biotin operon repressor/biotin-[acetyl-CoA-carboxylase] ligase